MIWRRQRLIHRGAKAILGKILGDGPAFDVKTACNVPRLEEPAPLGLKINEKSWIFTMFQGFGEIWVSKVTTPPRCVQA